tara:strand:- start:2677 stop:3777 length:1101 start_codon:yes stop_codon:yes gene_type:complete
MTKKAIITGLTGQDGSYLTELLIEKGYEVHGLRRRSSSLNTSRIDHLYERDDIKEKKLFLHYGELNDSSNLLNIINKVQPDEIYNLGAQSHVHVSFVSPEYTSDVNAIGALRILECIKSLGLTKKVKFYQASSSELFGKVQEIPQTEKTPFYPRSPYAVAKLYAYWITVNYRESYNMFACNGILFNHESPRRGETFVTRKITRGLSNIFCGMQDKLVLGNIDAKRDWGHAKDYVLMMWMMMQKDNPDDYVISTGKQYSVREFILKAANSQGVKIDFKGEGLDEVGIISEIDNPKIDSSLKGRRIIEIDEMYFRPAEVETLLGDYSKAKKVLGWEPSTNIDELASEMMSHDLENSRKHSFLHKEFKN